jgi:hypothetical protein
VGGVYLSKIPSGRSAKDRFPDIASRVAVTRLLVL